MPAITDLNAAVSANNGDLLPVVQGGETRQVSAELLSRLNWLGTVSESGGVPTGAIIERGSNANGQYVKFADGTLACFNRYATSSSADSVWTFPAAFSDIGDSALQITPTTGIVGNVSIYFRNDATLSQVSYCCYLSDGSRAAVSCSMMAVGRWF